MSVAPDVRSASGLQRLERQYFLARRAGQDQPQHGAAAHSLEAAMFLAPAKTGLLPLGRQPCTEQGGKLASRKLLTSE